MTEERNRPRGLVLWLLISTLLQLIWTGGYLVYLTYLITFPSANILSISGDIIAHRHEISERSRVELNDIAPRSANGPNALVGVAHCMNVSASNQALSLDARKWGSAASNDPSVVVEKG